MPVLSALHRTLDQSLALWTNWFSADPWNSRFQDQSYLKDDIVILLMKKNGLPERLNYPASEEQTQGIIPGLQFPYISGSQLGWFSPQETSGQVWVPFGCRNSVGWGEWWVLLTFSGQGPGMLLSILPGTWQSATTKNYPAPNSAEVEKPCYPRPHSDFFAVFDNDWEEVHREFSFLGFLRTQWSVGIFCPLKF